MSSIKWLMFIWPHKLSTYRNCGVTHIDKITMQSECEIVYCLIAEHRGWFVSPLGMETNIQIWVYTVIKLGNVVQYVKLI